MADLAGALRSFGIDNSRKIEKVIHMKKLAFVFPGQGSQSKGMLSNMAANPLIKSTFDEASDVLGYDVWSLCQEDADGLLNQTEYTQPALLATSVALWRAFSETSDIQPDYMAGHSLGEYSAYVCAGAISFSDGLNVVRARGQYMQAAMPEGEGALAAIIGLDDDAVATLCSQESAGDVLVPANYNSPGQVVIAGTMAAVSRAINAAKSHGAKLAKQLPVSVPSHSALMAPAATQLKAILDNITVHVPSVAVVNNVDVTVCNSEDGIRDALIRQLTSPVQWVRTIQYFIHNAVASVVECGPGKVLTGLTKRIDRNLKLTSIYDIDTLAQFAESRMDKEVRDELRG